MVIGQQPFYLSLCPRLKSNNQPFHSHIEVYSTAGGSRGEVYIAPIVDTTFELTCSIISPNKLLLAVSERLVSLYQLQQHAPMYMKPYTGHDNQNSPRRGQRTPLHSVLLLFNLEGFYTSSASLRGVFHIPA